MPCLKNLALMEQDLFCCAKCRLEMMATSLMPMPWRGLILTWRMVLGIWRNGHCLLFIKIVRQLYRLRQTLLRMIKLSSKKLRWTCCPLCVPSWILKFNKALDAIWDVVNAANVYIDVEAPWSLKKTDTVRMNTVLYVLCEAIRCLAVIIQPVMTDSASQMLDQLKIAADGRGFDTLSASHAIKAGTVIDQPQGVFPRLVEEKAA